MRSCSWCDFFLPPTLKLLSVRLESSYTNLLFLSVHCCSKVRKRGEKVKIFSRQIGWAEHNEYIWYFTQKKSWIWIFLSKPWTQKSQFVVQISNISKHGAWPECYWHGRPSRGSTPHTKMKCIFYDMKTWWRGGYRLTARMGWNPGGAFLCAAFSQRQPVYCIYWMWMWCVWVFVYVMDWPTVHGVPRLCPVMAGLQHPPQKAGKTMDGLMENRLL